MRLALFEPDIPQNTGTLLRLGACLGVGVDIIEPCGFLFTDKGLKRAGMDYLELANYRRHEFVGGVRGAARRTARSSLQQSRASVYGICIRARRRAAPRPRERRRP